MYTDHYGFSGHPFQLTPDPRFWFESETHRKAMAYLGYGLAQGEGFIVITGDIGAGKTTLVAHLMATIDTARLSAVKIVSTQLDSADLLRMVAQQLGLATEGAEKAQLLDRIERYLHAQARDGKRTLVIVDEAQNLPISALEELRMLSNFQSGGRALIQIFLLGQPEFRDRLRSAPHLEQLRQRVIATHHLDPMGQGEVEPYLVHRLALVGWQGNPRFTHDACAALYHATDGVPRRLNTLAGRVLLLGAIENLAELDAGSVHAVLADLDDDTATGQPESAIEPDPFESATVEWPLRTELADRAINDDAPAPAPTRAATPAFDSRDARIASLESRQEEQEAALRRVLTLLVDWVESEEAMRPERGILRNSAA